jgi:hypothetical protein
VECKGTQLPLKGLESHEVTTDFPVGIHDLADDHGLDVDGILVRHPDSGERYRPEPSIDSATFFDRLVARRSEPHLSLPNGNISYHYVKVARISIEVHINPL